ncbi:MAG: baseplate J/gp47 family protein [Candidatus Thiodiazotropha sp. (ex Dulcina madagascariensis)]|nr:baseplate J/gp47 family protein [Candidatus Thiodiazotropha sp. (ex Dulcina madagascariensis)]
MPFSGVDLSKLPPPAVVQSIDYEGLLAQWKAYLINADPALADVLSLESDPLAIDGEATAYQALLIYQRINEAARSVMLNSAAGADLDNLAALVSTARLVDESDDRLRLRAQMALEGITTAGSHGSYLYHALSADPDVLDVDTYSPGYGAVVVTVLTAVGDGIPDEALLATVSAALNDESVRPLTETVIVQAAAVVEYAIKANLTIDPGPDPELIRTTAVDAVNAYVSDSFLLGRPITRSGIFAALHQPEVRRVVLAEPASDLLLERYQVGRCQSIEVNLA